MTKFEYLKQKAQSDNLDDNTLVVCTYEEIGQPCKNTTKMYVKDTLYKVAVSTSKSELGGCLIMCLEDSTKAVDWTKAKIFDAYWGEITFGNNIVSPIFKLIMLKEDYEKAEENSNKSKIKKSFVPFDGLNKTSNVIIDENTYQRIISVLGTPFITEEELEYTREQITDLAIRPALEEYFHWVPPLRKPTVVNTNDGGGSSSKVVYKENEDGEFVGESASVSEDGGLIVDMPADAYGVTGISLQQSGQSLNSNILSPMFYAMEQSLYSGFSYTALSGVYNGRTPYTNTNSIGGMLSSRAASQALVNYTRRVHYEGPYMRADGSKYIKLYSNVSGVFNVWWAGESLDFNDVEYANRRRVIEYAQACVKELFASLRRQAKSDIPGQFDYNQWLTEAEKTKETITSEWKSLVKYAGIMRGSL